MKNNFKFSFLQNEDVHISDMKKEEIFFAMLNLMENKKSMKKIACIAEMGDFMKDEFYYIAHKILVRKGRTRLFGGASNCIQREIVGIFGFLY